MKEYRQQLPPEMLLASEQELKEEALVNPSLAELLLALEEEGLDFEEMLFRRQGEAQSATPSPGQPLPNNLFGPRSNLPTPQDGGILQAPTSQPSGGGGGIPRTGRSEQGAMGRLAQVLLSMAGGRGARAEERKNRQAERRNRRGGSTMSSRRNKISRPPPGGLG